MSDEALIESLERALEAAPADVPLRLHLIELLVRNQSLTKAVFHVATVLQYDPKNPRAHELLAQAAGSARPAPSVPAGDAGAGSGGSEDAPRSRPTNPGFDWDAAEAELDGPEPMFVGGSEPPNHVWGVERVGITLADVGGLAEVKERLEMAFLAPLKNPGLRQLYGKSLRGGLLLYGPPGCGKTYLARALAGELGAQFISVGLEEILDMWLGNTEKNVHELFVVARQSAPAVVFLDEVDALGQRRSRANANSMRGAVNQLLTELDGVSADNEGVFVVAATNQPWDVDPALRRPGRLDRTVFVQPPDAPARAAIFRLHLSRRPVSGVDVDKLAKQTAGRSGADIAHICESAAELALRDAIRSGAVRMITMGDLEEAARGVPSSIGEWLRSARNVVNYGDPAGSYAELKAYLRKERLL